MAEEKRTDKTLATELNFNVRENASKVHGGTEKKREVKLTAKAFLEKISHLEYERKTKINKLSKWRQSITALKRNKECVKEVQNEFKRFLCLSEESHQVHKVLLDLLPVDEAQKHEIWYQAKMLNVHDFVADTQKWLVESQGCTAVLFDAEQNVVQIQGEPVSGNDFENAETSAAPAKETDSNIGIGNEVQHKDAGDGTEEKEPQIEPQDSISNVSLRTSSNGFLNYKFLF